ncbi:hypothetical protein D3C80_1270150 [compost metagenome]
MQQIGFLRTQQAAAPIGREGPALGVFAHHFRINGECVDINVGHDGVEMHTGAVFWQLNGNHAFCLAMRKQALRQEFNTLRRGSFRQAN